MLISHFIPQSLSWYVPIALPGLSFWFHFAQEKTALLKVLVHFSLYVALCNCSYLDSLPILCCRYGLICVYLGARQHYNNRLWKMTQTWVWDFLPLLIRTELLGGCVKILASSSRKRIKMLPIFWAISGVEQGNSCKL